MISAATFGTNVDNMAATRRDGQELLARLAAFGEVEAAAAAERARAEIARLAAQRSPAFLREEARTAFVRCGVLRARVEGRGVARGLP